MSSTLYTHIRTIWQVSDAPTPIKVKNELNEINSISNAYLLVDKGKIIDFGLMSASLPNSNKQINLEGKMILPTWVDSHTHLIFAKTRETEFVDRIKGLSYAEIAAKGGGIHNSAAQLKKMSEDTLFNEAMIRLDNIIRQGTGAIEIKSGYGLDAENELKMLRVIKRMKSESPIPIKATFLGAHALPQAYKNNRQGYIDQITNHMLPIIAEEELADYCDVFCEKGFFSPSEMEQILQASQQYGIVPKIHTNQFNSMGGIEAAIRQNAISVDHLEVLEDHEIELLADSGTMATLLPGAAFFLDDPYPPARKMIEKGVKISIATDYNPGSCPTGSMAFMISLACIKMKMLPMEAINASTINAAFSLSLQNELGSIERGKRANFIITKNIPSLAYIPYALCSDFVSNVIINGERYQSD